MRLSKKIKKAAKLSALVASVVVGTSFVPRGNVSTANVEPFVAADLYSAYLNLDHQTQVPQEYMPNFKAAMTTMWGKKLLKSPLNTAIMKKFGMQLFTYHPPIFKSENLVTYEQEATNAIQENCENISWNHVQQIRDLTRQQTNLLRDISCSLEGKDLLAYAMTELFPRADGELNAQVFDFLVHHAGSEFVENIPSQGDTLASSGLYQFTQYAVYDAKGRREGASRINLALPEHLQIPGSVVYLSGKEHHSAAHLLQINNLAGLLRELNTKQLTTLENVWREKETDIVQYIAMAHHRPTDAVRTAKRWLDNGAAQSITISASPNLLPYARKTRTNLEGITNFLENN